MKTFIVITEKDEKPIFAELNHSVTRLGPNKFKVVF